MIHSVEDVANNPDMQTGTTNGKPEHRSFDGGDGGLLGILETGFAVYLGGRVLGSIRRRISKK